MSCPSTSVVHAPQQIVPSDKRQALHGNLRQLRQKSSGWRKAINETYSGSLMARATTVGLPGAEAAAARLILSEYPQIA